MNSNQQPLVVKPEIPFEKPTVFFEWEASSRVFESKSRSWFVTVLALSALMMIVLALLQQGLLALMVGAFVFMLYALNKVEPQKISYEILNTGVRADSKLYEWKNLRSFYIQAKGETTLLQLTTFLNLPHRLEIILPKDKVDEVETTLLRYLPYHEEHETDYLALVDRAVQFLAPRLPTDLRA